MTKNICFPIQILINTEINNKTKNIMMLLYRHKDNLYNTRLSLLDITRLIDEKWPQNVNKYLKSASKYFTLTKEKKVQGMVNVYTVSHPRKDFILIPYNIYDKYCKESDVVVNYVKMKWIHRIFYFKNLKNNTNELPSIYDYMTFCKWSAQEFADNMQSLVKEGLIKCTINIDFLQENIFDDPNDDFVESLEIPEKVEKKQTEAQEVVDNFYQSINGKCANWAREVKIINDLLTSFSIEQIQLAAEYNKLKGKKNLLYLSSVINEAIETKKIFDDSSREGTIGYLIKKFHVGLNLKVNKTLLTKYAAKIQALLDAGYTYKQVEMTIDYMISKKEVNIYFIGNKISEAIKNGDKLVAQNNPCFKDRNDLVIIENELKAGRQKLKDVPQQFREEVNNIADKIFRNAEFNSIFNHFEWAIIVGYKLSQETFRIAETSNKTFNPDLEAKVKPLVEKKRQQLFGGN